MGQDPFPKNTPQITEPERCSGCGRCIAICPEKLYNFEQEVYRKRSRNIDPERCRICGRCISNCPLGIIKADWHG